MPEAQSAEKLPEKPAAAFSIPTSNVRRIADFEILVVTWIPSWVDSSVGDAIQFDLLQLTLELCMQV